LGILTSGDTILRQVRAIPLRVELKPHTIGIDDFALRKGHRYGTVVVDHESHRVVDLLPERSSESTARWLLSQPQVQVITRDRSSLYAKGITTANPDAIQVADRFHLHANLREALVRLLDRHHREISAAAKTVIHSTPKAPEQPMIPPPAEVNTLPKELPAPAADTSDPPCMSKAMQLSTERRARRLARYEQVIQLKSSGMSLRAISRKLGMGRDLVTRFLRAGSFPERAKTRRPRTLLIDCVLIFCVIRIRPASRKEARCGRRRLADGDSSIGGWGQWWCALRCSPR
jgi:transposase